MSFVVVSNLDMLFVVSIWFSVFVVIVVSFLFYAMNPNHRKRGSTSGATTPCRSRRNLFLVNVFVLPVCCDCVNCSCMCEFCGDFFFGFMKGCCILIHWSNGIGACKPSATTLDVSSKKLVLKLKFCFWRLPNFIRYWTRWNLLRN